MYSYDVWLEGAVSSQPKMLPTQTDDVSFLTTNANRLEYTAVVIVLSDPLLC